MTSRLTQLEGVIDANQRNFYQIGKALKQIRNERLFKDLLFDRFETYVKQRWDMSRSQAYRLIEASAVVDNLSPIGDGALPANESQARALARYKKEEQRKIWRGFICSGITLTAANLRKYARDHLKRTKPAKKPKTSTVDIIAADFKAAAMTLLEQIRLARNDGWQTTSKQAALFWLKMMRDVVIENERL